WTGAARRSGSIAATPASPAPCATDAPPRRPAMPRRSCAVLVLGCALALAAGPAGAEDLKADLSALRRAGVDPDGPALVRYFEKRTVSEEKRAKIAGLIARLGADEYDAREKATAELTDLGGLGRALLTQALKHPDLEVRKRVRTVLARIG